MIEKGAAGRGQFDPVYAAVHQRNTNLVFEITDLSAERGWAVCSVFSAATVRLPGSATATK